MKILGFYAELWDERAGTPDGPVRDFVREAPEPDEQRILAYLKAGHEILSVMGKSDDVLGSGEQILGGDSLFTDGAWVWRGDLRFYLHGYHVALPVEFLQSIRATNYARPHLQPERVDEICDAVREII
ncbi:hypothetical protein [Streptomyces sp. NPDC002573]|uniref:hypothetical protein n=1 Tax=Streptomyces sp. NPDC002573 TaxID=3364651 RepID=UPI0036C7E61D